MLTWNCNISDGSGNLKENKTELYMFDTILTQKENITYVQRIKASLPEYLRTRGKSLDGEFFKCPLHHNHSKNDRTPSCHVDIKPDGTYVWFCHNCKIGGTVYDLAYYEEGLAIDGPNFVQASIYLANLLGIPLDESQLSSEVNDTLRQIEMYQDIETFLLKYGNPIENLTDSRFGRSYTLEQAKEIIKIVPVGSVEWRQLETYLQDTHKSVYRNSVFYKNKNSSLLFSKETLTFSYRDQYGRPIRFIGRVSNTLQEKNSNISKYLQSPGLYGKKKELPFLLHNAIPHIKRNRSIIIVEGEFDAISMHLLGHKHTVASRGTSFTDDFVDIVDNLGINDVILMYDNDTAGIIGIEHVYKKLKHKDLQVYVKPLPEGYDPDRCLVEGYDFDFSTKKDVIEYLLTTKPEFNDSRYDVHQRYRNVIRFLTENVSLKVMLKKYAMEVVANMFGFFWEDVYNDIDNYINNKLTSDKVVTQIHEKVVASSELPLEERLQVYEQAAEDLRRFMARNNMSLYTKTQELYNMLKRNTVKMSQTIKTGFTMFDFNTSFLTGTISFWAGWPSNGKTTTIRNVAMGVLKHNDHLKKPPLVVYFSLDDDERNTMINFMSMVTRVPAREIRNMIYTNEWSQSAAAKAFDDELSDLFTNKLHIYGTIDCKDVASMGRIINITSSAYPDRTLFVIVDALNNFVNLDNDNQIVAMENTIREIKRYASMYDTHIAVIVHNKKHPGITRRPLLSDLKGSSFVEHEAQQIILAYMETHYKRVGSKMTWLNETHEGGTMCPVIELTIAKDKEHKANTVVPMNFNPYDLRIHEPNADQMVVYMEEILGVRDE